MKERTLGIVLALITTVLLISPLVLAFSANNWSVKGVFTPPKENIESIREEVLGLQNPGQFETIGRDVNKNTGEFEVYGQFNSSADFDIVLTEFDTDLSLEGDKVGKMSLNKKEVFFKANEATNFTLAGQLDDEIVQVMSPSYNSSEDYNEVLERFPQGPSARLQNLELVNSTVKLRVKGVHLEIRNLGERGFV